MIFSLCSCLLVVIMHFKSLLLFLLSAFSIANAPLFIATPLHAARTTAAAVQTPS